MIRQEQQANGTHVAEISWVVVPRDENDKEEISDADKVVLLSGEWPRFLTDISPIFAAYYHLRDALHLYLQAPNRDKTLSPQPSSEAHHAALKIFKYEGADDIFHERNGTYARTVDGSLQVETRHGLLHQREYAAVKLGLDMFCIFDDGVQIVLSVNELLDSCPCTKPQRRARSKSAA
jgi:hypothetical protein